MSKLTAKQEKFAVLVFEDNGMSNTDAFLEAYPIGKKWKRKTVHERASRLFNNSKVQTRIAELREKAAEAAIVSRQEILIHLSSIIRKNTQTIVITRDEEGNELGREVIDAPSKDSDIIKASERISKMQGWEAAKVLSFDANNTDPMSILLGKLSAEE